jgi:hypothetical protein
VAVLQKEAAEMSVMQLAPDMVTVNSHVGSLSLGALMIVALVGMARVAMELQVSPLLLLTEKLVLLLEYLSHPCRLLQDLLVKNQEPLHPTETLGNQGIKLQLLTQKKSSRALLQLNLQDLFNMRNQVRKP